MARIIVVTSGKGGVGKTTTSAAFAMGLAERGFKTAVIDFDVGLRNLDLIMGCERRVVFDFVNVIQGEANVGQALIKDKRNPNLYVLPASQTRDKDALTIEGVGKVLERIAGAYELRAEHQVAFIALRPDGRWASAALTGSPDWAMRLARPSVFSATVFPPVLGPDTTST